MVLVQFVNTNLSQERSQILQAEKRLSSLPGCSTDIFKRINITLTIILHDHQSHFVAENIV